VLVVKRFALPSLAILAAWMLIDALVHRLLFRSLYALSPGVWRPVGEINSLLAVLASLGLLVVLLLLFEILVRPRSLSTGLLLGGLFGAALAIASGLGTYIHSPIPVALAVAWSALAICKGLVAGAILGAFTRRAESASVGCT